MQFEGRGKRQLNACNKMGFTLGCSYLCCSKGGASISRTRATRWASHWGVGTYAVRREGQASAERVQVCRKMEFTLGGWYPPARPQVHRVRQVSRGVWQRVHGPSAQSQIDHALQMVYYEACGKDFPLLLTREVQSHELLRRRGLELGLPAHSQICDGDRQSELIQLPNELCSCQ
jgi:hypothetical protein